MATPSSLLQPHKQQFWAITHIPVRTTAKISAISSASSSPSERFPSLKIQPVRFSSLPTETHDSPPTSSAVFVKGLPLSTAEGRLNKAFSEFGEVKHVNVVREKVSKQSIGSAFVWFYSAESARLAAEKMNGKFFDGRFISVEIAVPKLSRKRQRAKPYKF